jgi:hypothetical protein
MIRTRTPLLALAAAGVALAAAGCAQLVALEDVGVGAPRGATLTGEIRSVDTRRGRIAVRDSYNGHQQTLRVDRRTQVVYRQRSYPVTALERGDVVRVRVHRDRDGQRWADRIDVRESVRDRRNPGGWGAARVERVDGTVGRVEPRRGYFTVLVARNQTLTVLVPGRVGRDDARRLERLRRGERVRLEVRFLGRDQAELVRFR